MSEIRMMLFYQHITFFMRVITEQLLKIILNEKVNESNVILISLKILRFRIAGFSCIATCFRIIKNISDWEQFITIQTSKWLDMVTNWTLHSDPNKVNIIVACV